MLNGNGHHANGHSANGKAGELGGFELTPGNRKVRADLQLIAQFVDVGTREVGKLDALIALCDTLMKKGRSERDRLRAAELKLKLMSMTIDAAESTDKRHRLDAGQATENVADVTHKIAFDRGG